MILVVLIVLIVLVLVFDSSIESFISGPSILQSKIDMMKSVTQLLDSVGIEYAITGRTLEGALVNSKIYNDNANETIVVKNQDSSKLLSLGQQLFHLGYSIEDTIGSDKTFYIRKAMIKVYGSSPNASLHIIPMTQSGQKWICTSKKGYSHNEFFYNSDLFPTQNLQVSGIILKAPGNPLEYYNRYKLNDYGRVI
jgi:hypothetical protein